MMGSKEPETTNYVNIAKLCEAGAIKPIRWHDDDTDKTIIQVKEHNASYKALCLTTSNS